MAEGTYHVLVLETWAREGVQGFATPCGDHSEFARLPSVCKFEGKLYGKTGWNSDRNLAYYRTDAKIALTL